MLQSREHSHVPARGFKPFVFDAKDTVSVLPSLAMLGIVGLTPGSVQRMYDGIQAARAAGVAMDTDLQASVTTASISTPVQFLQNWLPGFIGVITAARKIDDLTGITVSGKWEDEEAVQGILEQMGTAVPYGDYTNVPLSSWNVNYERRTNVRFEEGLRVGVLEEARAARIGVSSAVQKRAAATLAMEINRNKVGFLGYNSGNNRTYGFLNDPNLPAATVFPNGASGNSLWSGKTFLEITKDIRLMVAALRAQAQDVIDPASTPMTLAVATSVVDYLSVTSDFGTSVWDWLAKSYPKIRVVSAPELELAYTNDNVAYLYAETVDDTQSTDDRRTWLQIVPAKFRLVGTQQMAKGYEEDYSNATAGVFLKRPYAIVRYYNN